MYHRGQQSKVRLFNQDGSKVFTASCDKTAKMWDLNSNQAMQIAQVRTRGSSSGVTLRKERSHLKLPYFFTARRPNQSHSLDKSPKLQLCHDWKLGQNTEGIEYFLGGKMCTFLW